jgi:hypothetical protein
LVGLWSEAWGWWVGPGRARHVDDTVGDRDGPVPGVQVDVMAAAEQDEVMDCGRAAVDPGVEVVGVAVDGWCSADDAAFVASIQGTAHRPGDQAFRAADIEWFGLRAEDQRDDLGVTGETPDRGC